MSEPTISFEQHISPMFAQFRAKMTWRLDLTNYDDVKANAASIQERIESTDPDLMMPPRSQGGPLSDQNIAIFALWVKQDFGK